MHDALIALRPGWYDADDDKGVLKVVMTGSAADGAAWQQHIRTKPRRKHLADRFRDAASDFQIVIVRDMWLTGFDAPSLHTMYVDKPMRGHNLMQAIARVNRVYPGKDGGLIVAYLPIQTQLQQALQDYTEGDQELSGRLQDAAAEVMQEKYEIVAAMFHGFDYTAFFSALPTDRLTVLSQAVDFILGGRDQLKARYIDAVTALARAFALAMPHEAALAIRKDVAFFEAVRGPLVKTDTAGITGTGRTTQELDAAVQRLVDRAVAPDGIIDLFAVAGLERPRISIVSDEFLVEVKALPRKNVAVELLRRLIEDEIKAQRRTNLVQARSFAEMLAGAVDRYNRQAVSAVQMINELIELAKEMQAAHRRGDDLGLSADELAFYDALAANQSAVEVMGDEQLAFLARELLQTVRRNATIDWSVQENARARMRIAVKRLLRQYGYPPDLQETATRIVVEQAELLAGEKA
jgi:type I restriction enzyme R subunit